MNHLVFGNQLADELRKALGISRPVRSITIKADCREAALVTVEFVPGVNDVVQIANILKQYQLVQVEPIETRHVSDV